MAKNSNNPSAIWCNLNGYLKTQVRAIQDDQSDLKRQRMLTLLNESDCGLIGERAELVVDWLLRTPALHRPT